jgi:hypothetical protein
MKCPVKQMFRSLPRSGIISWQRDARYSLKAPKAIDERVVS